MKQSRSGTLYAVRTHYDMRRTEMYIIRRVQRVCSACLVQYVVRKFNLVTG